MGTKNRPGQFDCYEAAHPDEPMFILLARDPLAPMLVDFWAAMRALTRGLADPAKVYEAQACAKAMREWKAVEDALAAVRAAERDATPPPASGEWVEWCPEKLERAAAKWKAGKGGKG